MSTNNFKPHSDGIDAAELVAFALNMMEKQGAGTGGSWLAEQLCHRRYSESDALSAMRIYREKCPQTNAKGEPEGYPESEMLAAIDRAYGAKTPNGQKDETKTKKRKSKPKKVSAGFEVNDSGLYHLQFDPEALKVEPVWVSSPITPAGLASSETNADWHLVVEFPDRRKRAHTCLLPCDSFAGQSGEQVVRPLLAEGMKLSSAKGAAEAVRRFLMQSQPDRQFLLVDKPGWYDGVFVLGDSIFGDTTATNVIQRAAPNSLLRVKGSAEDWIAGIGTYARANKRLQHGISLAFAAPLCQLVGAESGVFHFKARSRQGKTTILLCAGSACGGGGRLGYAHSWLMTPNAAELACTAHNDLLLCLDELKVVDPRAAGALAYTIASGQGKQRMQKSLGAAPTLSWRTLGLSSGELDLATHVASAQADELYGGQLVRFVEIPEPDSPFGMFDAIPDGETAKEFADKLRRNAHLYYGAPLRKYLSEVVRKRDHYAKVADDLIRAFTAEATGSTDSAEIVDVAQRFGLTLAGGAIATRVGCTDWDENAVWDNERKLFDEWRATRGSGAPADEERAIRQVRQILEAHGSSRFVNAEDEAAANEDPTYGTNAPADKDTTRGTNAPAAQPAGFTRDQLGFRRQMLDETRELQTVFLIWPERWASEFCRGLDPVFVARTLHDRGYLMTDKGRHGYQLNVRVPGYSHTKRLYAVRETILD